MKQVHKQWTRSKRIVPFEIPLRWAWADFQSFLKAPTLTSMGPCPQWAKALFRGLQRHQNVVHLIDRSSCAIRLRFGCGHKHPCVFHGHKPKGDFRTIVSRGGLGLRVSNHSGLRPAAILICSHKTNVRSCWRFQMRVGVAGDVAAQIASDLRPQVEGH